MPPREPKPPAAPKPELPLLRCAGDADWERWLTEHHGDVRGVWLEFAKRGSAHTTPSHAEALDTAICFGWIDGQVRAHPTEPEDFWLQRFTPRGPKSRWSQINRDKAQQLIRDGRMRPSGQAQYDAAHADGRLDAAYEPQSRATIPADLERALDANPAAKRFFATLTGPRRYAFLYRLHHVKTPQARERRIARYIELLNDGRTLD